MGGIERVPAAAYERIRADIGHKIASGQVAVGERLPPEQALAKRYGVTRMTVRHAVDHLLADGLVTRKWGVGTFISDPRPAHRSFNRLQGLAEEMANEGRELRTEVLALEEIAPMPEEIAKALALDGEAVAVFLKRLRFLEDRAVSLQHSWLPFSICPSLVRVPLVGGSLYATLKEEAGIELSTAEQTVTAVAARKAEAELLEIRPGAPLLSVERCTIDTKGRVIEYAHSWSIPEMPVVMRLNRRSQEE